MGEVPGAIPGPRVLRGVALAAIVLLGVLGLASSTRAQAPGADAEFVATVDGLATADFPGKSDAVAKLVAQRHASAKAVLAAFLDGKLHARTADDKVFITDGGETTLALTEPLSGKSAGAASPDDFSRITTNNGLRRTLRSALAGFALADPDSKVRLDAVREMIRSLDDDSTTLLRAAAETEQDGDVRQAMLEGLAVADLGSESAETRLAAVNALENSLGADVYNRLAEMARADADERVRTAAAEVVASIDSARQLYGTLETLFFGLSLGSVLVLAAIGLAITFGVMGIINMAHGELIMLGAYTTYVVQLAMPDHIGLSILVAIPLAFLVSGAVGVLIERGVVRFLYGRPLETLLATFGVSLVLQQVVRDVFTANNRPVETPSWMAGSLQVNEAFSLTYNRLYVILFMVLVFVALQIVLKKTSLGLQVRAVAQNRTMARAMGVRTEWVDALTFGLGSGIAGVAGVALSQLTNVGPNLGQQYIIDSFMVVVFGGVGNLWGTLIGGMSLGVANKILEPWAGAVLAKILVLVALILFIQRRPRGLFPQKGRAAEG
jgi:urea transport system permease protein